MALESMMKKSLAQQLNSMPKIWVIGNGQLGMMMQHAAIPLAVSVLPMPASDDLSLLNDLSENDVVTPEIEAWAESACTDKLAEHTNFINRDVFPIIADRKTQKATLDKLNVATAKWQCIEKDTQVSDVYESLGERVLLKRRRGGYDGRGQYWLKQAENIDIPADFRGEQELESAIAEQAINFEAEVSVIGVRSQSGTMQFYPLSENHHVNGILKASIGCTPMYCNLQTQAEKMLSTVMEYFDYVGVMAMECFVVPSELAPRVHNSGHWTQAGSSISQFEAHVRAVADLPMAEFQTKGVTVMINLVGVDYDQRWLDIAGAEVFWYNKEVRAGRKVGHINLVSPTLETIEKLALTLPEDKAVFEWVKAELTCTSRSVSAGC